MFAGAIKLEIRKRDDALISDGQALSNLRIVFAYVCPARLFLPGGGGIILFIFTTEKFARTERQTVKKRSPVK